MSDVSADCTTYGLIQESSEQWSLLDRRSEYHWDMCNPSPTSSREMTEIYLRVERKGDNGLLNQPRSNDFTQRIGKAVLFPWRQDAAWGTTYLENRSSVVISHIFVGSIPVVSDERVKGYKQEFIRHWTTEQ